MGIRRPVIYILFPKLLMWGIFFVLNCSYINGNLWTHFTVYSVWHWLKSLTHQVPSFKVDQFYFGPKEIDKWYKAEWSPWESNQNLHQVQDKMVQAEQRWKQRFIYLCSSVAGNQRSTSSTSKRRHIKEDRSMKRSTVRCCGNANWKSY